MIEVEIEGVNVFALAAARKRRPSRQRILRALKGSA